MKSLIFTLAFAFTGLLASAQCTPDLTMVDSGLAYENGETPCFTENVFTGKTIFFKNFDEVTVAGVTVNVDSIRVDSIAGLPCGVSWTTNKAAQGNIFATNEIGCFQLSGTSTDGEGVYKTEMYITPWVNGGATPFPQQPASLLNNTRIIVKVVATGTSCTAVTDTVASSCYTYYTSVNDVASNLSKFNNQPNPFSNFTNIIFTAKENAVYTVKVVNMLGAVVYQEQVSAEPGVNAIRMERNGLPAGVYVYSITNGTHSVSKRMMIAE